MTIIVDISNKFKTFERFNKITIITLYSSAATSIMNTHRNHPCSVINRNNLNYIIILYQFNSINGVILLWANINSYDTKVYSSQNRYVLLNADDNNIFSSPSTSNVNFYLHKKYNKFLCIKQRLKNITCPKDFICKSTSSYFII